MRQTGTQREVFIPLNRRDLIELCLAEQRFSTADAQEFRDFCEILAAYFHFQFHANLEAIKANYAPFNPNVDVHSRHIYQPGQLATMQTQFIQDFCHLLEKSNYFELSHRTLRRALEERSLVALQTDVDFDEFQKLLCYYRGDISQDLECRNWLGQKKARTIDIFERVVLLIQFQDENYFIERKIKLEKLNYIPGKIYLYFYRDVPKYDLELLFPNVKTHMTWKDRLMLLVPAVGAGIAIILKVLPQLLLVILAIFVILQIDLSYFPDWIKSRQSAATVDTLAIIVATLSMAIALGGFAFKQYTTYKSKKIQFQKNVTDALFFRSIANHSAVFQLLIDLAEEEECKEVILAYFHLLIHPHPLSANELDQMVEQWMEERLGLNVDFDIQDALDKLQQLKIAMADGQIKALIEAEESVLSPTQGGGTPLTPSFKQENSQQFRATPLPLAKQIIDRLWDNAFSYNKQEPQD